MTGGGFGVVVALVTPDLGYKRVTQAVEAQYKTPNRFKETIYVCSGKPRGGLSGDN